MVIAQYHLNGVAAHGFWDVAERCHGNVAGERRLNAVGQEAAAHLGHAVESNARILKVTATREFPCQVSTDLHGGLDRPSAVGIDPQRHQLPKCLAELAQRLDLNFRVEHATLEFDGTKTVLGPHLLHLFDERLRREGLAVFVVAQIVALAATAGVLVERIRGERHLVAHASADKIANRLANGFADQVEAGRLDCGIGSSVGVERIFTGDVVSLRTLQAAGAALGHRREVAGQAIRARADDLSANRLERLGGLVAAVRLGDAGDAVVADQLDDVSEGVRLVQPIAAAQRWVGHGDGVNPEVANSH